jgi:DNA-directed RNA polymerase specialized sigma24 family protein
LTPTQFETFYDSSAPEAYGLARSILLSEADAQAVVRDAYVRVWEHPDGNGAVEGVRAGLLRVVRALSCERLRASLGSSAPVEHPLRLRDLPDGVRDVMELALVRGLTVGEISACLGVPASEVCSRMTDGLRVLGAAAVRG